LPIAKLRPGNVHQPVVRFKGLLYQAVSWLVTDQFATAPEENRWTF
jgi:hypothetical protein